MYEFLSKNNFIENRIQKGFTPGMSGTFEHTAHLAYLIRRAKKQQRSLTIALLDLRNAFGEVHHKLIQTVLKYHQIPEHFQNCIANLYILTSVP
jgi:flagellar biosynthesis chaperone FliJ